VYGWMLMCGEIITSTGETLFKLKWEPEHEAQGAADLLPPSPTSHTASRA